MMFDWVEVYGALRTHCGYTTAEIDGMELPDYLELLDYWGRHPPTRWA